MGNLVLSIAKEYSRCPGARYEREGDYSGERFRETLLYPRLKQAIEEGVKLEVILDGSAGYSTSFIEESFGGLIRTNKLTLKQLEDNLIIISEEDPSYLDDIKKYLNNAWAHSC
ncbi:MAG: STAS-like domain-containing protein [Bacteroidales bacterium]|nr:STAS-like domain-containing protein [Bacteroidales bacterium]